MTIEINGMAHVILTVSRFDLARPMRNRWFEAVSLQRRVCELLVPKRRSPICRGP